MICHLHTRHYGPVFKKLLKTGLKTYNYLKTPPLVPELKFFSTLNIGTKFPVFGSLLYYPAGYSLNLGVITECFH